MATQFLMPNQISREEEGNCQRNLGAAQNHDYPTVYHIESVDKVAKYFRDQNVYAFGPRYEANRRNCN
jgi:hypothetical protein